MTIRTTKSATGDAKSSCHIVNLLTKFKLIVNDRLFLLTKRAIRILQRGDLNSTFCLFFFVLEVSFKWRSEQTGATNMVVPQTSGDFSNFSEKIAIHRHSGYILHVFKAI